MTKLIVRTIQTPTGPKVMLCDDQGTALPMQRETVVTCGIEQVDSITVTFLIDGERIALEPSA